MAEKNVKINLNGKTMRPSISGASVTSYVFRVESGCTLTIDGEGVVDAGSGSSSNICVWMREDCSLKINGGTFKVGRDSEGSGNSCIYIHKNGAKVEINGGEFHCPQELSHHPGWYYLVNLNNSVNDADIQIKGGVFYGWDPATGDDEQHSITMLAEGYESYVIALDGKDDEGRECAIYGVRKK